jgi:hypothetical protein
MTDRPTVVAAVRRTACCHQWRFLRGARAGVKGIFDPLADDIFLAADAMHIDALQDVHAGLYAISLLHFIELR